MGRIRRFRSRFHPLNTFDFSTLEPGDLVLVANPTDPCPTQAVVFWSHVAIYVGESEDRAFVDAVDLPVRRAERLRQRGRASLWSKVRFTPLGTFRRYTDVLALRPDLPAEKRKSAAEYARAQVGRPFDRRVLSAFLRSVSLRRSGRFTCANLIWHAYLAQGFDLASGPFARLLVPWPSLIGHDRRLIRLGGGTRYKPLRPARGQLGLYLARAWFRYVLRSDIAWRGAGDV